MNCTTTYLEHIGEVAKHINQLKGNFTFSLFCENRIAASFSFLHTRRKSDMGWIYVCEDYNLDDMEEVDNEWVNKFLIDKKEYM